MKTLLKIAGTIAILASSMSATSSFAYDKPQEFLTIFYDDEWHSNVVGTLLRYCDGEVVFGGTRTLYTDTIYMGCD